MSTIFDIRSFALPKVSRRAMLVGALVVVLAIAALAVGAAAIPQTDQHHGRRVFLRDPRAVPRRQGSDHGCAGRCDRQDRAGRRQDASHLPLQHHVQGARQRHRVDPQPQPGGLAHHPAVTALHRWAGAERRRGDPDRAHPGAGRVGPAARVHQRDPAPARARQRSGRRGRSASSSNRPRTTWPARASRSTTR